MGQEQTPPPATLKVLTLNVFAGTREMDFERLDRQINEVQRLNPDVICLQEVFDNRVRANYRTQLNDYNLYSGYVNSQRSLGLSAFHSLSFTPGQYALADGDRMGLSTLVRRSLVTSWSHHRSMAVDNAEPFINRGCSDASPFVLLEQAKPKGTLTSYINFNGVEIKVINTHMSNQVQNPLRQLQAMELAGRAHADLNNEVALRRVGLAAAPVIICGDTNADGEQPEMRWLREQRGFQDTYLLAHPDLNSAPYGGMTWDDRNPLTASGNLAEPDQRVDYVYFLAGSRHTFETQSSTIVFDQAPWISDHYGVLSEIKLVDRRRESPLRPRMQILPFNFRPRR